tara:strand:+ start:231 stop:425 length:195 start_codon:yes stop_codon:yes gene_type:complete
MIVKPIITIKEVIKVDKSIFSPIKIKLKIIEKMGIDAKIKTTFATLVCVTAKTKAGVVDPIKKI